ncbi:MAG: class E sortase [Acidimicrobiales bacterium]
MIFRVVGAIGRVLVGVGLLILLFVAYLLWGTGLSESGHQNALKTQFEHALAARSHSTTTTSPGSSTTVPSSLAATLAAGLDPPEGDPIALLRIPKIDLSKVVVQGTGTHDLQLGPGHYDNTPLPGQAGNSAIAGHRTTYGAPFYNLNELGPGDDIFITSAQGDFTYKVTRSFIVSPSDGTVIQTTSATPTLTLTTCNPRFSASQRLVVTATLTSNIVAPTPTTPTPTSKTKPVSGDLAGTQGAWGAAALWGAGVLAFGVLAWFVARRRRRVQRWMLYGASALPMLVLLYFFFENVNRLLPASY